MAFGYIVALLVLLFVSCRPESSPTPGANATPSATKTVEATPHPTPRVEATTTPIAGGTPSATFPTPVPATAESPSPTATFTPMVTQEAGPGTRAIPKPPRRDLYELARSLALKLPDPIPPLAYETSALEEGHRETFNIVDPVEVNSGKIDVILRLVSDHAYWYVQEGITIPREDLEVAAQSFETRISPLVTKVFGPLWPPGTPTSRGPRLTILHARLRGLAGYYSSIDE